MGELKTKSVEAPKKPERRRAVSTAELFTALEGLLPFAEVELECLADFAEMFPNDPDHAVEAERVRAGNQALDLARQLIARKSVYVRREASKLQAPDMSDGE